MKIKGIPFSRRLLLHITNLKVHLLFFHYTRMTDLRMTLPESSDYLHGLFRCIDLIQLVLYLFTTNVFYIFPPPDLNGYHYSSACLLLSTVPHAELHSCCQWSTSATLMQLVWLGPEVIHELLRALHCLLTHLHRRYL